MYKKIFIMLFIFFGAFFISYTSPVEALSTEVQYRLDEAENCDAIFGDPKKDGTIANFLQQAFTIMSYAGPILCLVLSIMDFAKAAASQDKDALMKTGKITIKRIILALILFFLPVLINYLFPLFGWYGTCGIE